MVQNNINGSLNKWADIDWREKGHPLGCPFFVYFHFYIIVEVTFAENQPLTKTMQNLLSLTLKIQ